ncbi:hypothetical protein [Nostoc sp.]|uniref:hypothetical protein n=1 Tax=Nostoc sp. TaxID=1180 RepID=UPI002FF64C8F
MAIKHPVLIALSTLSIIYVSTASVSALYLPRPTALPLTKDNQKSPSIIHLSFSLKDFTKVFIFWNKKLWYWY